MEECREIMDSTVEVVNVTLGISEVVKAEVGYRGYNNVC